MGKGWERRRWWRLLEPAADDPEIEHTLEHVLTLASGAEVPAGCIPYNRPQIAALLDRHRVVTIVSPEAVGSGAVERLRDRQREIAAGQLRIRHAAINNIGVLTEAGIETRVLKGLATAELDYPQAGLRHSGDVDLAVAPEDLDHALEVLAKLGCVDLPTPFDPVLWYGQAVVTPDGVEIDLHTRLFRRSPLGRSLVDEPGVPLERVPGSALVAPQRLVHAAGHFLISPPGTRRMNGFLDIGRLVARPDLDLDEARDFAAELNVEGLVCAGIRVEAELSERSEVLEQLRGWRQPDWLERQTRLVAHRRLALDHLARYREVPTGHRLRYLPTWLLPSARQRRLFAESVSSAASRLASRAGRRGVPT